MGVRGEDVSGSGELQGDSVERSGSTGSDSESTGIDLPWKPRSRQEQGRQTERGTLKRYGVKGHPNSGAGKIKFDGSDEDCVMEVKDAAKSYTLNRAYLESLFKTAARQGKEAVLVVEFPDLVVEAVIRKKAR